MHSPPQLPSTLKHMLQWTFVGPMGPNLPASFYETPIMAVDGGGHFVSRMDVWLGDNDSFGGDIECPFRIQYASDKESSDLKLALDLLEEDLPYELFLWGFLGGRRDHELFNLGEGAAFVSKAQGRQIHFYDDQGKILFRLLGPGVWKITHEGLFSLGVFATTSVRLLGQCQYQLPQLTALSPFSSQGLSNRAHGTFEIQTMGPCFLYFPELSL